MCSTTYLPPFLCLLLIVFGYLCSLQNVVHKSDFGIGSANSDGRRTGGLRRSVSKRLLGKAGSSGFGSSKSIADLRSTAQSQQQLQQQQEKKAQRFVTGSYFSDKEDIEEGEEGEPGFSYFNSSDTDRFLSLGKEPPFLDKDSSSTLLDRLHDARQKAQKMDMVSQTSGPRFVKRSAYLNEQSRYDAVGYPKSTRSSTSKDNECFETKSISSARSQETQSSLSTVSASATTSQKKQLQSASQPKLKGFQARVINTHSGKAVVHAPILAKPAVGSDCKDDRDENMLDLLPPSAAELRYNAQRALINTTAVLRTAVLNKKGSKANFDDQRSQKTRVPDIAGIAATLRVASGASRSNNSNSNSNSHSHSRKPLGRTASEGKRTTDPAIDKSFANIANHNNQDGFHISMRFSSELSGGGGAGRDNSAAYTNSNSSNRHSNSTTTRKYIDGAGSKTAGPKMGSFLEQGRASTGSSLEQWGIVTAASLMQTESTQPEQGGLGEYDGCSDSDSAAEDAIRLVEDISRGCPLPLESMVGWCEMFCLFVCFWTLLASSVVDVCCVVLCCISPPSFVWTIHH
ncbi:hypothetical protein BX070DRAFT_67225 [Coemansia spiralis]|nr:hypothetical protein BX070DRAFT_67225 [Coemansia spiralis]